MRQDTLRNRFFLLVTAIGATLVVAASVGYFYIDKQSRLANLQQQAGVVSSFIAYDQANDAIQEENLSSRLNRLSVYPIIQVACVYGPEGRLFGEYRAEGQAECPVSTQHSINTNYVRQESDIISGSRWLGRVVVYASRSALQTEDWKTLGLVTLICLLAVLLVALLAHHLAGKATASITSLTAAVQTLPVQGGFLPTPRGPKEVSELALAFQRVIDRLTEARNATEEGVAQRLEAERDKQQASQLLTTIIDLVPYVIFARRRNGNLVFANKAAAAVYGTTIENLLSEEFRSEYRGAKPDHLIFGDPLLPQKKEIWFTTPEGDTRRYLMSRVPFENDNHLVVAVDISEEHRLQLQLQFSQRLEVVGTLAGGIAHDFNNLLTPIMGYTSILLDSDLPDAAMQRIRAIDAAAEKARNVVKQILTFSRQQQHRPDDEPVDLNGVVEEATTLMRATIPSIIVIDLECEPVGLITMGSSQLHQVVANLCTNAAQAIGLGRGTITLRTRLVPIDSSLIPQHLPRCPYACLEVSDTGPGMDDEVQAHIFEPFFTTRKVGEGSGLGLSVVHGIVTGHEGDIAVESTPGAGTTFRVLLPLSDRVPKTQHLPGKAINPATGERLLVVDDEASVLQVTHDLLESVGYSVDEFSGPEAALATFRDHADRYTAVLTDHSMPAMTGVELAQEMRKVRADIPIILVTGFADQVRNVDDIDLTVMKPMTRSDLDQAIRAVVQRHRTGTA